MKKTLLLILIFTSASFLKAQEVADAIIGKYTAADNRVIIEITKRDDKYYGKFLWTKTEGILDLNNPVETEKTKPLKGMEFLKDFVFDGKKIWSKGTIYDPENGITYKCKIKRKKSNDLHVRGFISFSLFGRSIIFSRVTGPVAQ